VLTPEGFSGQRLRVLPQPLIRTALTDPLTGRLLVTDAGHFPHATSHGRARACGAPQAIVILCADGAGWLELDGERRAVVPGDAVLIPARTAHRYGADLRDPWSIWWLHVQGRDTPALVDAALGPQRLPVHPVRDMFGAIALARQVIEELERDETWPSLYAASGSAWHLFAMLAAGRRQGPATSANRIRLVQDHLRAHLAEPTNVPALARLAGLSTSHFGAQFRAATGTGVIEYVKRLRIARAREMLVATDSSIKEIAAAVGYDDPFYFARRFHSVTGMSPTAFRTASRQDVLA
jgi:AraC family transcriptional regulator of arabinose operon